MLEAQIFVDKEELKGMTLLYEYIMQFLIKHHIAGATCFRGQEGFGRNQLIKRPDALFSFDEPPMMIVFIDTDEKVRQVLTALRQEVKSGFIVVHPVEKWD